MKVIGLVGMPASGKGEFVRLARDKDIPVVRMGDLVWEEVRRRGLALEATIVGKVANAERERHGFGIWAERTVRRVHEVLKELPTVPSVVVIDGIRGDAEVEVFRREWDEEFVLLGIHASPSTRLSRVLARKREDDTISKDDFCKRDERELRWGIGNAIAQADFVLINEGTLEEFQAKVNEFLNTIATARGQG